MVKSQPAFHQHKKNNFLGFSNENKNKNLTIRFEGSKLRKFVGYLGVFIDNKLNWTKQLDAIVTELSVATRATYWLQKYISKKSFIGVYQSIV